MAEGVCAFLPPAHAAALEPLADHALAGTLHYPAADAPALGAVGRVIHALHLVAEVPHHLRAAVSRRAAARLQPAECLQHRLASLVLEAVAPGVTPALRRLLVGGVQGFGELPEVFRC